MVYQVRLATMAQLNRIEEIYSIARKFMAENGNPTQWGTEYPSHELLVEDIQQQKLFTVSDSAGIHGVFYFTIGEDPTYGYIEDGTWRSAEPYGTIHRIAGDGSGGILRCAVDFCGKQISHLRIDTHADNQVMQRAVAKLGFCRSGVIYVEDGTPRIAYDRLS